jgi:hypothetical protein
MAGNMTRDDIIRMAQEAGLFNDDGNWFSSSDNSDVAERDLFRFAALVAAAEREREREPVAYRWNGELFTPNEIRMLEADDAVPDDAVPLYAAPPQPQGCSECGVTSSDDSMTALYCVACIETFATIGKTGKQP